MEFEGKTLTKEQALGCHFMELGEDVIMQAPAGSGKTWTLKAGSSLMKNKMGIYLAFNKPIAVEAGKTFPGHVECKTTHSAAHRGVSKQYTSRLGTIPGFVLAKEYDIGETRLFPTRTAKGYLVLDTISKFCHSNDTEISSKHVPYLGEKIKDIEVLEFAYQDLPIQASRIWEIIMDKNARIPVSHDMYLKIWALDSPKINKDFILFDEAQDANPVILDVVNKQKHAQKIFVGDRYQQIYAWRGAENAMESCAFNNKAYLTQSFRFGAPIADLANKILSKYSEYDKPLKIIGNPEQQSLIENFTEHPDAVICRTNGEVIANVFRYIEDNKIYIQGGPQQLLSLLKGADALRNGKKTGAKELSLFNNWDEFVEYSESSDGGSMKVVIRLLETYGANALIDLVNGTESNARNADVVVTTAHKSKGLEWNNVRLGSDFMYPQKEGQTMPSGERNLLYVAATRALKKLDISECVAANVDWVLNNLEKE